MNDACHTHVFNNKDAGDENDDDDNDDDNLSIFNPLWFWDFIWHQKVGQQLLQQ